MEQMQKRLLARSPQWAIATAIFLISAGVISGAQPASTLPCPALELPIATNNPQVKAETELGFRELLLGWEESACYHFGKAIAAAEQSAEPCLMAYCGMMLAAPQRGAKDANRMALLEALDTAQATPIELFYINTFLKLLGGDIAGAAADFEARASKYRRDIFSRYWAIMLLHCADVGYDMLERPEAYQERALTMASELYAARPQDAFSCYLRAYVEEAAPVVTPQALEAATRATELMPEHPMPALLCGHLLYRSSSVSTALPYLQKAVKMAVLPWDKDRGTARLQTIASLYELTALWVLRDTRKTAAAEQRLLKEPISVELQYSPQMILLRWEAHTFPLRKHILAKEALNVAQLRAVLKKLPAIPATEDHEALQHYRECLKAALYTRARMLKRDQQHARQSLQIAKDEMAAFIKTQDSVFALGAEYYTPWYRAKEACEIAVLAVGAEVYPDPTEFWKKAAHATLRPATMLMPPPLPESQSDNESAGAR